MKRSYSFGLLVAVLIALLPLNTAMALEYSPPSIEGLTDADGRLASMLVIKSIERDMITNLPTPETLALSDGVRITKNHGYSTVDIAKVQLFGGLSSKVDRIRVTKFVYLAGSTATRSDLATAAGFLSERSRR